jgi:SOS-response transcriptional repressor LexA
MNIGDRMKQRRKQLKLTADEVAEKIGVSRSNVYRYEKGDIEKLPLEVLEPLSEILQTTPQQLMGWESGDDILPIYNQLEPPRQKKVYSFAESELEDQNKVVSFPVYGKTAAGTTPVTYGDPDVEHKDFSSVPNGADVALVVSGDSMEPLISDGSIVFYKSQPHVENGEIAIIEIEGDGVTCKRVKFDYENEKIILQSENDKYEEMVFDHEQVRILGKVLL